MLLINGVGNSLNGRVHPDSEVKEMMCQVCKDNTPFLKKIGKECNYIFWIPLPSKKEEQVYWECNYCNKFVYFDK